LKGRESIFETASGESSGFPFTFTTHHFTPHREEGAYDSRIARRSVSVIGSSM
jgi:hypothetical protein